jgi:outer membrane lipoprotein SlyB
MKAVFSVTGPFLLGALLLFGCAETPYFGSQPSVVSGTGIVDRIEVVNKDDPELAGTLIGGVVGGVLGHQVGSGRGQTVATIIGAAGSAYAGHEIQRLTRRPDETLRVTVRMDSGAYHTVTQDNLTDLRTGDRVRVDGGRLYRY